MPKPRGGRRPLLVPCAIRATLLAAAISLGACASQSTGPLLDARHVDPVLLGHAQWCTNPPSGYCAIRDRR